MECMRAPRENKKASSVIFAGSLVLPKSVLVRPVALHAERPLFPQFSVNVCLEMCQNAKDPVCTPGAGFAIVDIFVPLHPCSKGSRKQRPRAGILGYISAVLPRRKARVLAHTHTQHSILKTIRLTQRNPNTQNSFDVP